MLTANKKRRFVVSYLELFFLFALFASMLALLYQKDLLKEQVLAESSNYDLTATYLENMLRLESDNERLMLAMAEVSINSHNFDLAQKLIEVLYTNQKNVTKAEVYSLDYKLYKERYFQSKDEQEKVQLKKKLEEIFSVIMKEKLYDDLRPWYNESRFLENRELSFELLKELLKREPKSVDLLKDRLFFTQYFEDIKGEGESYKKLIEIDIAYNAQEWKENYYYYLLRTKNYDEAKDIALELSTDSTYWKNELAEFYMFQKEYKNASKVYLELFYLIDRKNVRDGYLISAINALSTAKAYDEMTALIKKYEKLYSDDAEMNKRFLKLYLSINRLDLANGLAKKILTKSKK